MQGLDIDVRWNVPVKLFPEPDSRGCAGADRSTTMFAGGAEWSATGLPGRSLAGDSFGQADNKFAAARSAARALWNGPPDTPRCPPCGAKCMESVFDSMCRAQDAESTYGNERSGLPRGPAGAVGGGQRQRQARDGWGGVTPAAGCAYTVVCILL